MLIAILVHVSYLNTSVIGRATIAEELIAFGWLS